LRERQKGLPLACTLLICVCGFLNENFLLLKLPYLFYELWGYDAMRKSMTRGPAAVEQGLAQILPACRIQSRIDENNHDI
jgi:hypothetical protein